MAKIKIADYDAWYDDNTGLIIDDEGGVRSSIPDGTFHFGGKLYTYGTKVRIVTRFENYIAEFKKDTEQKRVGFYPTQRVISMKETKEYFDGKHFELDDIFAEIGGSKKTYLDTYNFDNNVSEIIEPVEYVNKHKIPSVKDTPPIQNGYRTAAAHSDTNPSWNTWRDHLFNCEVDASGNVVNWYAPMTFGFEKYVYTIGTRVIIKHRQYNKNKFYVATFDGYKFVIDGYGKPWETLSDSMFKRGRTSKGFSIVQILEPHYYKPVAHETTAWERFKLGGGAAPVDTGFGTLMYIVVMIGGSIFKDRILIWVAATVIYFLWKYGYTNK